VLPEKDVPVTARQIGDQGLNHTPRSGIVFLNACGTTTVNPRAVTSIVRELIYLGREVIITTWCDVPDNVAAVMSRLFYEGLLDGDTVGGALWRARGRLLREYNNPLGLLYTVQGNSRASLATLGG
jgi:CHAT domain-containing protein